MDFLTSPAFAVVAVVAMIGWVLTTWIRVRHGYPLEGSWGQALKPAVTVEQSERLKLLTQENAQMAAELGALRDRVQTLERIVTDGGARLHAAIDGLRH